MWLSSMRLSGQSPGSRLRATVPSRGHWPCLEPLPRARHQQRMTWPMSRVLCQGQESQGYSCPRGQDLALRFGVWIWSLGLQAPTNAHSRGFSASPVRREADRQGSYGGSFGAREEGHMMPGPLCRRRSSLGPQARGFSEGRGLSLGRRRNQRLRQHHGRAQAREDSSRRPCSRSPPRSTHKTLVERNSEF